MRVKKEERLRPGNVKHSMDVTFSDSDKKNLKVNTTGKKGKQRERERKVKVRKKRD